MAVIRIIELVTISGAYFLLFVAPFLLVVGWGQLIVTYFKHASAFTRIIISLLLFLLVFFPIEFTYLTASNYMLFSAYPLWWLLHLIGLITYIVSSKDGKRLPTAFLLAGILYVVIILTFSAYYSGSAITFVSLDADTALGLLGIFANAFLSFTFALVSLFRFSKKNAVHALVIGVSVTMFSIFLHIVFPLPSS